MTKDFEEWLYYVPPQETEVGIMPGFFGRAVTREECKSLEEMGGRRSEDWRAYASQEDDAFYRDL